MPRGRPSTPITSRSGRRPGARLAREDLPAGRPRRWRRRAALAAAALAIVGAVAFGSAGPAGTARGELAARLGDTTEPERFSFAYRAGGTRVLDCVLPNREFTVAVDQASGVAEIRPRPAAPPVAILRPGREALLHRSLFRDGGVATTWLRVDHPVAPRDADQLGRVLGVDLAGYVVSGTVPPSGRATVLAALDIAREVSRLGRRAGAPAAVDGFRITVDADRLDDVVPRSTGRGDGRAARDEAIPLFDVWLDERNDIVRVEVRPSRPGDERDEPAAGWAVDYSPDAVELADRGRLDVTDLREIDSAALRPRTPGGCEMPL